VLKGELFVDKFEEKMQYSFLDYISGGFELNFMVAVDFTGQHLILSIFSISALEKLLH
jgi:hypothetical protein